MIFQVAGPIDDVGTRLYNQQLPQHSAEAVVNHLVAFYGIARERLKPDGYGQTCLTLPGDPKNAANCQVEIINLAPVS